MRLIHHIPYLHVYLYNPFLVAIVFTHKDMPKRKSSAYYSQLAKRRLANANSDISTRVSVDTNSQMATPQVSVDTSLRMESSRDPSSGTKIII